MPIGTAGQHRSRTQRTKSESSMLPTGGPTPEQIRQRAYQIYVSRGATHGNAAWDWQQAELELKARIALLGRP